MTRKVRKDRGVRTLTSRTDLTQEMLKHLLHYEPITGDFTWLNPLKRVKPGEAAGSLRKDGYVVIKISNWAFKAHRLACFYMTGEWPKSGDHRDGNPANNRWLNLRFSTHQQNCCNREFKNKTGHQCVSQEKNGTFSARVKTLGVRKYLGSFATAEAAASAVTAAKLELHGEFSVDRRIT